MALDFPDRNYALVNYNTRSTESASIPNPFNSTSGIAGVARGVRLRVADERFIEELDIVLDKENGNDYTHIYIMEPEEDGAISHRFDISDEDLESPIELNMNHSPLPPGDHDLVLHSEDGDPLSHSRTEPNQTSTPHGDADEFQVVAGVIVDVDGSPSTHTTDPNRLFAFKRITGEMVEPTKLETEPIDVSIQRSHTSISSWSFTIPFDYSWEDEIFSLVELYWSDELLVRGFLSNVETTDDNGETTLSGNDLVSVLEKGSSEVWYQSRPAWEALDEYIAEETQFTPNVTEPTVETLATREVWQEAETEAGFDAIMTERAEDGDLPPEIRPVRYGKAATGETGVHTTPISWWTEAEFNLDANWRSSHSVANASHGQTRALVDDSHFGRYQFTTQHEIPAGELAIAIRCASFWGDNLNKPLEILIDNEVIHTIPADSVPGDLTWIVEQPDQGSDWLNDELTVGTHSLLIRIGDASQGFGAIHVDGIAPFDHRYLDDLTFPDTVEASGYLSGPERYPVEENIWFNWVETPYHLTSARAAINQDAYIAGDPDPIRVALQFTFRGTAFFRDLTGGFREVDMERDFDTDTLSDLFVGHVRGLAQLGRRDTTREDATPTTGFEPHVVKRWVLDVTGDDLGFIDTQTMAGTHLENIQRLCELSRMRFVVPTDWQINAFKIGDQVQPEPEWDVIKRTRRVNVEGYANQVTIFGTRFQEGDDELEWDEPGVPGAPPLRIKATVTDDDEVLEKGRVVEHAEVDTSVTTLAEAQSVARSKLSSFVNKDRSTGNMAISPMLIDPGYSYPVTWGDKEPGVIAHVRATVPSGTTMRLTVKEDEGDTGVFDQEQSRPVPNGESSLRFDRLTGGPFNSYDGYVEVTRPNESFGSPAVDSIDLEISDVPLAPDPVPLERVTYGVGGASLQFDLVDDLANQFAIIRERLDHTERGIF